MWLRKICITLCVCGAAVCGVRAQQVTARIAGLEENEEYMSLLREDVRLQIKEDSVIRVVNRVRQQFKDDTKNRQLYAKDILSLEEQIFNIRNVKGRLTDRISTIEQNWVISNLGSPVVPSIHPASEVSIPEKEKVRNLVYNRYFEDQLPAADYAALNEAQRLEMDAVDYVNRYMANYHEISQLAGRYAEAKTEAEAAELYGKYRTMQGLNAVLADSLAQIWNYIFDNKSYAYGYLLDKLGQEEMLSREEQSHTQAVQQLSEDRGRYASDALTDYFLRKRLLVDYETQVANLLELDAARDSLRGVAVQLKGIDPRLPRIEAEERFFIDYAPLTFTSPSKYNADQPIPECKIFRQGTIYRVQIGTFSSKRPVAAFKGVYPLCYQQDEEGKWRYFAGGFATEVEAKEAVKLLKSKGFVRPEIVVWRDGIYRNLTRDPELHTQKYKVEIEGVATLPDAVKEAVAASGHELSRAGQELFVVGLFNERAEADKVAAAIRKADTALEIKITEVADNPK